MIIIQAIKDFFIEIFEHVAQNNVEGIKVNAVVLKHSISYGPEDIEFPKYLTVFSLLDPEVRDKYGDELEVDSRYYYMSTKNNDRLVLWLKENPEYDPHKSHSPKLIPYE